MAQLGNDKVSAEGVTPILYVKDFATAKKYYTQKLLFELLWDWGDPPTFGCVKLDKIEIFFCEGHQGKPGTWLCVFMEDVDGYYERIKKLGAEVIYGPTDEPWGMREIHVRDPNQHVIRFGQGIPCREPKLEIERVPLEARIEKRLAALIQDVASHNNVTLGEMLEETLLHSMEPLPKGGVASPHTRATHRYIQELRKKHGIDYDCHASYRFAEKTAARDVKAKSKPRKK
ncbi:MAG: VOC family protein [Planctomycetes bacterium]|nr:VOC family protein [Planctomycetota bacterium]